MAHAAPITLTLAHSPDADDAYMWWPLTGKVHPRERDGAGVARVVSPAVLETGRFRFSAIPADIEVLNRRAIEQGDLDITALSMHAFAHAQSRYALTACGASMGDGYGPKLVCREEVLRSTPREQIIDRIRRGELNVAIPGRRTTAFLVLSLMLGTSEFPATPLPFDQIIGAVVERRADAGLVIHDAQLTFAAAGLAQLADLGEWWKSHTGGLPLPLGANAMRRDLDSRFGPGTLREVAALLQRSVRHALAHHEESLAYAAAFAPDASPAQAERFVRMYVNDFSVDAGPRGRAAIQRLLEEGAAAGLCPAPGTIELI